MLNPTALQVSSFRKRVFGMLFENRFAQNAGCIHALTNAEAKACRNYGLRNPIAIVPLGIDIPERAAKSVECPWPDDKRKTLLYLGRLHPIKGLPNLIEGFFAGTAARP